MQKQKKEPLCNRQGQTGFMSSPGLNTAHFADAQGPFKI